MAYGEKYKMEFESWDGVSWVISILKLNYAGSSNDINAGREPFKITWGGKDDYFKPLHGSECLLTLMSESDYNFIDLHTNDGRGVKVVITRAGSTYWSGFVLPEKFSEPLVPPPYPVVIRCSDQLGTLDNYDYAIRSDQVINRIPYFGEATMMACISEALQRTGLELNIHSANNLFETNMDKADTDDPFAQAIINQNRWLGENLQYINSETGLYEPTDCKTVIHDILSVFGARIFQRDGVWWITRIKEQEAAMDYRVFTYLGVYSSNSSINPILTLTDASTDPASVYINHSSSFDTIDSYKQLNIVQEYDKKTNMIIGGQFQSWEVDNKGTFTNWVRERIPQRGTEIFVLNRGFTLRPTNIRRNYRELNTPLGYKETESNQYILIKGEFQNTQYLRSNQITVEPGGFYGHCAFSGFSYNDGTKKGDADDIKIQLRVIKGNYFWTFENKSSTGSAKFGAWFKNEQKFVTFSPTIPTGELPFSTFEFSFDPIPDIETDGTATMELRLYASENGSVFDDIIIQFIGQRGSKTPIREIASVKDIVNENSTLQMPKKELKFGDILTLGLVGTRTERTSTQIRIKNSWNTYNGYIKYADSALSLSTLWLKKGDADEDTLINHLAQNIVEVRLLQKERVMCEILERNQNTMSFLSTVKDTENFDKFFIWDTVTYQPKSNIWNGTMLEILNPDQPDYRITEADEDFRITEDGDFRIVDYSNA